jgi:hypothetical protein
MILSGIKAFNYGRKNWGFNPGRYEMFNAQFWQKFVIQGSLYCIVQHLRERGIADSEH